MNLMGMDYLAGAIQQARLEEAERARVAHSVARMRRFKGRRQVPAKGSSRELVRSNGAPACLACAIPAGRAS